jgi:23S rRNA pseudouridine1911/1915/1917 synthase
VGHPVVGNGTYGGGGGRRLPALPPGRHFLHAAWLLLQHPVSGEMMDLRSPLPSDLQASLTAVAGGELGTATGSVDAKGDSLDDLGFYRLDDR